MNPNINSNINTLYLGVLGAIVVLTPFVMLEAYNKFNYCICNYCNSRNFFSNKNQYGRTICKNCKTLIY